jgi:hypothetical protein
MHVTLPNTAWSGLNQMPLEAAIGRLRLALYPPGGRQGDSKQSMD